MKKNKGIFSKIKNMFKRTDNRTAFNLSHFRNLPLEHTAYQNSLLTKESVTNLTLKARDPFMRKIVMRLVHDSFREGFNILSEEHQDLDKVVKESFKELNLKTKLIDTWIGARCYGSHYLVIGTDDGHLQNPLNIDNVDSINFLEHFHRDQMVVNNVGTQVDDFYRNPEYFLIYDTSSSSVSAAAENAKNIMVHASRVIQFDGIRVPFEDYKARNYIHLSLIEYLERYVENFHKTYDRISYVLSHFNQAVYKVNKLEGLMASGNKQLIEDRFNMLEAHRNLYNAIVIDSEKESFENHPVSLGGLYDMLQVQMDLLSGACNIPNTILYGKGPRAGLSSGEGLSEKRDWFDVIRSEQENYLEPLLKRVIDIIIKINYGITEVNYKIEFNKLTHRTLEEEAQLMSQQANTDATYINAGVVTADEVALSRFSKEEISLKTEIDLEARQKNLEEESKEKPQPKDQEQEEENEGKEQEEQEGKEEENEEQEKRQKQG